MTRTKPLPRLAAVLAIAALTVVPTAALAARPDKNQPVVTDTLSQVTAHGNGQGIGWSVEGTHATMAHVGDTIDATFLHGDGLTGAGIGVALIDTGVTPVTGLEDVWHGPDLSLDSQSDESRYLDAYGHGTHLAGIITSNRLDSRGIAPDATLVSVKAGAYNGAVDVTQVIAAIDWVVQYRKDHNIRVLVLAYGTDSTQDPRIDPLSHAVENAWRHGITVVVGAGNTGDTTPRLVNPATNPYVIAAGAVDTQGTWRVKDDVVPSFVPRGTATRTPDVYAPGVGIVSAAVPGGYLDTLFPDARQPGGLLRGNGTSQAAAVVGGAVALMLQHDPNLTPDQVKARLVETANASPIGPTLNIWDATYFSEASTVQTWPASLGIGSVHDARGTAVLSDDGIRLDGERDIHGEIFDSSVWARTAQAGAAWDEGTWNGTLWSGRSWSGRSWSGSSWSGRSWSGRSWSGSSWSGRSWSGRSWSGSSWSGTSWNGWGWNGGAWNSRTWS